NLSIREKTWSLIVVIHPFKDVSFTRMICRVLILSASPKNLMMPSIEFYPILIIPVRQRFILVLSLSQKIFLALQRRTAASLREIRLLQEFGWAMLQSFRPITTCLIISWAWYRGGGDLRFSRPSR